MNASRDTDRLTLMHIDLVLGPSLTFGVLDRRTADGGISNGTSSLSALRVFAILRKRSRFARIYLSEESWS